MLSYTYIQAYSCYNCPLLEKVIIPEGVEIVNYGVLCKCPKLVEVTLPDSITNMDGTVLWQCTGLKSVNIPNKLKSIG